MPYKNKADQQRCQTKSAQKRRIRQLINGLCIYGGCKNKIVKSQYCAICWEKMKKIRIKWRNANPEMVAAAHKRKRLKQRALLGSVIYCKFHGCRNIRRGYRGYCYEHSMVNIVGKKTRNTLITELRRTFPFLKGSRFEYPREMFLLMALINKSIEEIKNGYHQSNE